MAITNQQLVNQYSQLHKSKTYGQSVHDLALQIHACMLDLKPTTVLEYGCGQSELYRLFESAGSKWVRYDPAIEAISRIPIESADLVINTDVLEHIPRHDLHDVLGHIRSYSDKAFFSIATRPARERLPNGENAHCTVMTENEWLRVIKQYFPRAHIVHVRQGYSCLILTWQSSAASLVHQIELLKQKAQAADMSFFKRARRRLRKARRALFA